MAAGSVECVAAHSQHVRLQPQSTAARACGVCWLSCGSSRPCWHTCCCGHRRRRATAPAKPDTVWGGLLLTLIIAVFGIIASFPLGLLLALGRRSKIMGVPGWLTWLVVLPLTIYLVATRTVPGLREASRAGTNPDFPVAVVAACGRLSVPALFPW